MGKIPAHLVNSQFLTTDNKTAVSLDELGSPTDNTNLNSSLSAHGLLPKLSGDGYQYLDGYGNWSTSTDANAIHSDVAGEISVLNNVSPVDDDYLLIEDFNDSNNKKQINIGDLFPLGSKGDIFTYSTERVALGIGLDGQILSVDGGESTGLKWIDISGLTDGYVRLPEISDPSSESGYGKVYSKDVDGYSELFYLDDYGLVVQVTNKGDVNAGGGGSLPLTTKGDILTRDNSDNIRLGVGSDGYALLADSNTDSGLKWGEVGGSSPLTTKGDLYTYDTGDVRLSVGNDGQLLSVDSSESAGLKWVNSSASIDVVSAQWKRLGEDSEIGLSSPALACYQFDGSASELNDRTGNGYTLTIENGTRYYTSLGGKKSLWFNGGLNLLGPDTDDLRITGAITVELVGFIHEDTSSFRSLVYIGGDAIVESLITNILFDFRIDTSDVFSYFHEYALGSNEQVVFNSLMYNELHYFAITRSSDGLTVNFYIDGVLALTGTVSNAPAKDVSGNTQRLAVGNWYTTGGNAFFVGSISSVRVSNSEFTGTQVENIYKQIAYKGSPLVNKGDLYTFNTTTARLPVGNEGQVLSVDLSEDTGLKWIDSSGSGSGLTDGYLRLPEINDPSEEDGYGKVYSKDMDGYVELFYLDDYGLSVQVTNKGNVNGSGSLPLTTKGDILTRDGYENVRFGVGNDGYVLSADSNEDSGIKWVENTGLLTIEDDFNNSSINTMWSQDIPDTDNPDPFITEDTSKLSIGRTASGVSLNWWPTDNTDAPNIYMLLQPRDFIAKVFVSNLSTGDGTMGGMILYLDGTKTTYRSLYVRYRSGTYRYFRAYDTTTQDDTGLSPQQNYLWLAYVRRGNNIISLYSYNDINNEPELNDMIYVGIDNLHFNYTKVKLAIAALTIGDEPAYEIHFQKFSLIYG